MAIIKSRKCGIATIWDSSGEGKSDMLELDKFKTEAMAARENELKTFAPLIKELTNKMSGKQSSTNDEGPECYTYEVKHEPIEDPGGWEDIAADLSEYQERFTNKKTTGDLSEFPPPPPPLPRDLTEGKKPLPPENKDQLDGEVREYDVNLFGGLSKYFNAESLHHALVFGSIVFGLKMIEMNWSEIKLFFNSIDVPIMGYIMAAFIMLNTIIRAPKTNHTGFK